MPSFAASSPPAGGGATSQVVFGTLGAALVAALMLAIVVGHRNGRLRAVGRLAGLSERVSGLPGWAALPLAVIAGSLIFAVLGMYWDISIHIDKGRDPGPFANTAHYLILAGLFGITFAGLLSMALPRAGQRPSATAVRLTREWHAPLGGVLIFVCAGFALSGFPLDDLWHRIFGQDVTCGVRPTCCSSAARRCPRWAPGCCWWRAAARPRGSACAETGPFWPCRRSRWPAAS